MLRNHEKEAIGLLTIAVLPSEVLGAVLDEAEPRYCCTQAGYWITLKHSALPAARLVCHKPLLVGHAGGIECGFVVYLENGELTLECRPLGDAVLPPAFRESRVLLRVLR
jgi:hypothetical protein